MGNKLYRQSERNAGDSSEASQVYVLSILLDRDLSPRHLPPPWCFQLGRTDGTLDAGGQIAHRACVLLVQHASPCNLRGMSGRDGRYEQAQWRFVVRLQQDQLDYTQMDIPRHIMTPSKSI